MSSTVHSKKNVYVSFELSNKSWKLAFGDGTKERRVTVTARDLARIRHEVARAKEKFGLDNDAAVYSCYEAGRDGFWLARALEREGIINLVVDPASIEVNRRQRRSKTDRLDAQKLLEMLQRYWILGTKRIWKVVRVPSEEQEDARRVNRECERLTKERSGHLARIRSLQVLHGIAGARLQRDVTRLRDWAGRPLPEHSLRELQREWARVTLLDTQLKAIKAQRKAAVMKGTQPRCHIARKLHDLKGLGTGSASLLSDEFFAWRAFRNRREVGALAGLCGSPYDSGDSRREQGISKAGNRRIRTLMIETAWRWLLYQPQSKLSQWFQDRYGGGTKRMRRVGIVALARKLLVALWKHLHFGEIPEGAILMAR